MPRTTHVLPALLGVIFLSGCLSVVEPIQREYHVDTVIQPGEIYTMKVQVDDPSERVAPTICYNITTNVSSDGVTNIYVFDGMEDLNSYRHTLKTKDNLSDLDRRISAAWQPTHEFDVEQHFENYIDGGVEAGTYYFTVENTEFRRGLPEDPVKGPMKLQLDLYVANKDCPFS